MCFLCPIISLSLHSHQLGGVTGYFPWHYFTTGYCMISPPNWNCMTGHYRCTWLCDKLSSLDPGKWPDILPGQCCLTEYPPWTFVEIHNVVTGLYCITWYILPRLKLHDWTLSLTLLLWLDFVKWLEILQGYCCIKEYPLWIVLHCLIYFLDCTV